MSIRSKLKQELKDSKRPLLYVSRPTFFGVDYVINPWMDGHVGNVNRVEAHEQWKNLVSVLRELTDVRVVNCSDPKLPDVAFIANAGSFLPTKNGYTFFPANFKHFERRQEQNFFVDELAWDGFESEYLIDYFEGDGDLLRLRDLLVLGHGHRTDIEAVGAIARATNALPDDLIALNLIDHRFYHLDTCFFYHNNGNEDICMYYPGAFDDFSLHMLRRVCLEIHINVFEVNENEALSMICNAVGVGPTIIAHSFSDRVTSWLDAHGFKTRTSPLSEFHKAGGSAKCLTLRVPRAAVK